jgi:hypothetical protein
MGTMASGGMVSGGMASGGMGAGGIVDPCYCGFPCVWGSADFLYYWFKDMRSPPLVSVNTLGDIAALNRAGSRVLYGGNLEDQGHAGGAFTLGFGIPGDNPADPCCIAGFEGGFLFLAREGRTLRAFSEGNPVIGRPFTDISTGVPIPFVQAVANPAGFFPALAGGVAVDYSSLLYGFEANGICRFCCDLCAGYRVDALFGFRHLGLSEELSIHEDLQARDGSGETIIVRDSFRTRNNFYGGQLGLRGETQFGNWFVQATGKVALGVVNERVYIDGFTIDTLPPFAPVRATGGLLAQTSNIGRYGRTEFAVLPEVQVRLGYQVNSFLRLSVGYSFLWLSTVARPGDQIDTVVNTNLIPGFANGVQLPNPPGGPNRPAFHFQQTDFWAQGIMVGAELRY